MSDLIEPDKKDTTFVNEHRFYISVLEDLGFELVLSEDLGSSDVLEVYSHCDGMLLVLETSNRGRYVQSSVIHYNVLRRTFGGDPIPNGTFVTGPYDGISVCFAGSSDCRDGLRRVVSQIRKSGRLMKQWSIRGNLSICPSCLLTGNPESKRLATNNRVKLLPLEIRTMIGN